MRKLTLILLTILILAITGCAEQGTDSNEQTEQLNLKVGVMPAVDSAPIFLAEERGYFIDAGLEAEVQVYTNAGNRQSALQSGQLDGAMTDLIAVVNNVHNGFDIKVTTSTDGSFPTLVAKGFENKKEIQVGMMEVSVSNFLAEQYLGDAYKLNKLFMTGIPTRLEMLGAGKMDMAIIPEPLASMGELRGLEKRVYPNQDEFLPDAMVFTTKALEEKEEAIKLFHKAYNRAVEDINNNPDLARDILITKLDLKQDIRDLITLPEYHQARVPSREYVNKVIDWVARVQGIKIDLDYNQVIEDKFSQR